MLILHLAIVVSSLAQVRGFCRFKDIAANISPFLKRRRIDCLLKRGEQGVGPAENLTARCKQSSPGSFHYEMTWEPPPNTTTTTTTTTTALQGCRLYIMYEGGLHVCFQLPPTARSFIFDQSKGFSPQCPFEYTLTPQPISRYLCVCVSLFKTLTSDTNYSYIYMYLTSMVLNLCYQNFYNTMISKFYVMWYHLTSNIL